MATSTPSKINLVIPQNTPSRSQSRGGDQPPSQFSSPTTIRTTSSTAALQASLSSSSASAPLSVEHLLKSHVNSSRPQLSALEFVVNDRNALSAQNTQLWKLIEKQRSGYGQLMKELERVRGEREAFRSRLNVLGENTEAILKSHREMQKEKKESKDATLRATASHSHLRGSDSNPSSSGNSDPRGNTVRSNTDDGARAGPRASTPSKSREPPLQPDLTYHRERQGSQSSLNISISQPSSTYLSASHAASSSSLVSQSPATTVPPSASSSAANLSVGTDRGVGDPRKPSPLVLAPSRSESLPSSMLGASSAFPSTVPQFTPIPSAQPMNDSPVPPVLRSASNSSLKPNGFSLQPPASSGYHSTPTLGSERATGRISEDSSHLHSSSVPQFMSSTAQMPTASSSSSDLTASARSQPMSRESRVSLPEETKRYYASMGESPIPSPRTGHHFSNTSRSASPEKPSSPLTSITESPQTARATNVVVMMGEDYGRSTSQTRRHGRSPDEAGEFLEMEDEDSVYEGTGGSERISTAESAERGDDDGDSYGGHHSAQNGKSRAVAEDFPLPPSTPPNLSSGETLTQSQTQTHATQWLQSEPSIADSQSVSSMSMTAESRTPLINPRSASIQQQAQQQLPNSPFLQSLSTNEPPHATFRALPLLASDLPHTQIHVLHSSIRPNDRGKEVLSFVVSVDPGHNKDGWKIEKLYSDVLTLDSRIRSTVGKHVGKKLVTLPEGRLWKDHAPAKVDQRKAALELYLRSVIALPVKNKDEIIAFFTSDIIREAQKPVSQAGYKEGYLTKRGKNFGGWKTRYFVLQGPSLEYYESRGGTHLGSILITGAQIGRQQRSFERKDQDDDNDYRHAFLIIEAKKGPGGSNPRHVLCAHSDKERDSWVEILVRYVTGTYNDEQDAIMPSGSSSASVPRTSTSSDVHGTPSRRPRKDEISRGPAVPISQLAPDASNAKLFQGAPSFDISSTSSLKTPSLHPNSDGAKEIELPISSSLPVSSPLNGPSDDLDVLVSASQRANSELGHYPDLADQRTESSKSRVGSEPQRRKIKRRSANYSKPTAIPESMSSPEKDADPHTPRVDTQGKVKISGPMNGTPIPAGYKFGKDATPEQPTTDRREKAKSRTFWGFGRQHADKTPPPAFTPRAVFGIGLEDSLDVSQIAGLPAIVFRCIQYLEAKKADQEEGIYRLSGSSAVIKALKDRFNMEGDVDLLASDEYWDPHAIAGLLKTFLRELPASILTRDLHLRFLAVIDFVDAQERINELSHLIASLPIANYSLLRALTAHLILIVQNANVNKMTMRNVGIVFSPTLGIPAGVFSLMLGEFKRVFNVEGGLEDEASPADEVEASSEHVSRRNSKHYSDAAADKMLGFVGRTLKTTEESPSDEAEEVSANDDSDPEDGVGIDSAANSAASSSAYLPQQGSQNDHLQPSDYSIGDSRSRASNVAASRGLNISVSDRAGRRQSHVMGLPPSPRPPSSPHTPQTNSTSPP